MSFLTHLMARAERGSELRPRAIPFGGTPPAIEIVEAPAAVAAATPPAPLAAATTFETHTQPDTQPLPQPPPIAEPAPPRAWEPANATTITLRESTERVIVEHERVEWNAGVPPAEQGASRSQFGTGDGGGTPPAQPAGRRRSTVVPAESIGESRPSPLPSPRRGEGTEALPSPTSTPAPRPTPIQVLAPRVPPSVPGHFTPQKQQHQQPQQPSEPSIRVTIGRIDVRAVVETPPPAPRPRRQREPEVSLTDYLRTRNEGERR